MLTIKQLLQRPVFKHAKLLAGKRGAVRKVGWVHVLEISISDSFTNEHDLILTTGIGFRGDGEKALSYMKSLIAQRAAGLCIELGTYMPTISHRLLELADTYDFPLIVFEKTVRFVDITQDVHGILINAQHQKLKELESYSRTLQQLSLQSTDYTPILKLLHERTNAQVYFFNTLEKNYFYPPLSEETRKEMTSYYTQTNWGQEDASIQVLGNKQVVVQPIYCFGQTVAHLCVTIRKGEGEERILVDYTGSTLSQLLLRTLFLEEKRGRQQNELLEELMNGESGREEEFLGQMGLPILGTKGYRYLAGMIEIQQGMKQALPQDVFMMIRTLLKQRGWNALCMLKNQCIWILLVKEQSSKSVMQTKEMVIELVEKLNNRFVETVFSYGFGTMKSSFSEVHISFQEALQAISIYRIRSQTYFYDELGVYQLIKGISDERILQQFVEQHLASIIEYDRLHGTELLKTLDVLLLCNGSKQDAAKHLYIHRQTLYHRLEKLEELMAPNYLEGEKRLALEMALRIKELYIV